MSKELEEFYIQQRRKCDRDRRIELFKDRGLRPRYFVFPNNHYVAFTQKVASSSLALASVGEPGDKPFQHHLSTHVFAEDIPSSGRISMFVRDPVDRFASAMFTTKRTDVDATIAQMESGDIDFLIDSHFRKQSLSIIEGRKMRVFRLPNGIRRFCRFVGIKGLAHSNKGERKPRIKRSQAAKIRAHYHEDAKLFEQSTKRSMFVIGGA